MDTNYTLITYESMWFFNDSSVHNNLNSSGIAGRAKYKGVHYFPRNKSPKSRRGGFWTLLKTVTTSKDCNLVRGGRKAQHGYSDLCHKNLQMGWKFSPHIHHFYYRSGIMSHNNSCLQITQNPGWRQVVGSSIRLMNQRQMDERQPNRE